MQEVIDTTFWWIGSVICAVALLLGLSELGWWIIQRVLKDCGLWSEFFTVAHRMVRERKQAKLVKRVRGS